MSRTFLKEGRVSQKQRTRQDLLAAGLRIVTRGEEPTLEAVAGEAGVSRATAYRYFPRIDALLSVLPLAGLVDESESIIGDARADDPGERAWRVQSYFYDLAVREEMGFRRFLKATLEETLRAESEGTYEPLRGGYRLRTLDLALEPLEDEVDEVTLGRLRVALVALSGIESLVAVKDVCGLDSDTGRDALEWAARALVEAARREACSSGKAGNSGSS